MRRTTASLALTFHLLAPQVIYKIPEVRRKLTEIPVHQLPEHAPKTITKQNCFILMLLATNELNHGTLNDQDFQVYEKIKKHSMDNYLSIGDRVTLMHTIHAEAMPTIFNILSKSDRVTNLDEARTAFEAAGISLR